MQIESAIKQQVLQEMYARIDTIYDYMNDHFELSQEDEAIIIKTLNRTKDQLFVLAEKNRLS